MRRRSEKSTPHRESLLQKKNKKTKKPQTDNGERPRVVSPAVPGFPPRAQHRRRPLSRLGGNAQSLHTPARDWPAPQSFRADTSGQQLPPSSRPPLPALGKKSGQRGAGTKDPVAHGGATSLQAGDTNAALGPHALVLGGHTLESLDLGRPTH